MMTVTAVDDFVRTQVLPQYQPIVALIRDLMRECEPKVQEIISYGIPAFRANRTLAVINPTKDGITFAFSRGAEYQDRHGLLRGVGKRSKHIKIKDLANVNQDALRYYIRQALELDAGSR